MTNSDFRGCYTAIVTPFTADGSAIDWDAFEALVEAQIAARIDGIVVVGTTGESPTLTHEEHDAVIRWSMQTVRGRCKVIVGTGSNSTAEALHFAQMAQAAKVDAQLVVSPYYNKPTQEGLYQHFTRIADETEVPIILYNIQGRCGVNIQTDTLLRLAAHPRIIGVKEASGNIMQMMEVIGRTPEGFYVFSGDDEITLPLTACGGDGVISVASNVIPHSLRRMVHEALAGNFAEARRLHYALTPIMQAGFLETNPIPIKEMLALQGKISTGFRLPMTRAGEGTMRQLEQLIPTIAETERLYA